MIICTDPGKCALNQKPFILLAHFHFMFYELRYVYQTRIHAKNTGIFMWSSTISLNAVCLHQLKHILSLTEVSLFLIYSTRINLGLFFIHLIYTLVFKHLLKHVHHTYIDGKYKINSIILTRTYTLRLTQNVHVRNKKKILTFILCKMLYVNMSEVIVDNST